MGINRSIEKMEEVEEVTLCEDDPTKVIQVGKNLPPAIREKILATVKDNLDILVWCHADITGINPNVVCHTLNIDASVTPIRQKRRSLYPVRAEAVKAEVDKIMSIGFL